MPIIAAHALTKRFQRPLKEPGLVGALRHVIRPRYETKTALDAINLVIEPGELVGYVGPNGAGKSTTVKLLTGILVPSAGEVRVEGHIPHRSRIAVARQIGVVFGQRTQLWWDLPVQESFRLLGDLYQVPADTFARTLAECIELLDLGPLLRTPARQLSLGQRMRCDLAAGLLHAPPILFLDEPTIGLDVAVKVRIRAFIKTIQRERGVTVLPMSPALQVITQFSSIHGVGSVVLGSVVLGRALGELELAWGVGDWLLLILTLLSGTVLMSALNYATNCQGFWDSGSSSSFPFLMQNLAEFAKFPLTLYDRLVQAVLTWVVPFACVSYYPGLVLLGRPEAQPWMAGSAPLAAAAMVAAAAIIWRQGLARYQGTGH